VNAATTRVLSALALLPLLVALIWWAPTWLFQAVIGIAVALAFVELRSLVTDLAAGFLLGVVYIALPLGLLAVIRTEHGPGVLMIMIGTIIASDSGQYYAGRTFGKHKLAPVISP